MKNTNLFCANKPSTQFPPFIKGGNTRGVKYCEMHGAFGCRRMIGQPAAHNHYTASLSGQAGNTVVRLQLIFYIDK